MRRREFIAGLGSTAAWPMVVRAQQTQRPKRVGALITLAQDDFYGQAEATAFRRGLERFGWVEGKNIRIDFRFAAGEPAKYTAYAEELVNLAPDAILAGASPAVAALKSLTRTIPVVFVLTADPVGMGFVQSLARPGGNITGFSAYDAPMLAKWLDLLTKVAPTIRRVAVIFNPETAPYAGLYNNAIESAAPTFGVKVTLAPVRDDAGTRAALADHAREGNGGLIILPDSFTTAHRETIVTAAAQYNLPAIGIGDIFPKIGGLMSYWFDVIDVHAQAASYVDRILRGDKPADLPVQNPTKFTFILNLKTARALGLTIPETLLATADEVIE
jgi:putative tryptophan/tyrosine transport system substrate-binding protein